MLALETCGGFGVNFVARSRNGFLSRLQPKYFLVAIIMSLTGIMEIII